MKHNLIYPLIVGLCIATLGASAKSFIDVEILKNDRQYIKEYLEKIYLRVSKLEDKLNN